MIVVSEQPSTIAQAARFLQQRGYGVVGAQRAEDALNELHRKPFDGLVTPIGLPGIGGLELIRRVRERGDDLSIVALGGTSAAVRECALGLGADVVLEAPVSLVRVGAILDGLTGRGRGHSTPSPPAPAPDSKTLVLV